MKKEYKTSKATREATARWQAANPGYARRYYTGEHAQAVAVRLEQQGGRCAICRTDSPGFKRKNWHSDHCHQSGVTRGVLCARCNIALGYMKDDAARLRAAADYLDRHQRLAVLF